MSTDTSPIILPDRRIELPNWIYPPNQWENLDQIGYVALPAIGQEAIILSFQVPLGRHGIVNKVGNNFVGGNWVEGNGSAIWQIMVDGTPPPGATSYDKILASLGSPANPTPIAGFRIFENQVLTLEITNVSIAVAGQLSGGRLMGYLYPRELDEEGLWV